MTSPTDSLIEAMIEGSEHPFTKNVYAALLSARPEVGK